MADCFGIHRIKIQYLPNIFLVSDVVSHRYCSLFLWIGQANIEGNIEVSEVIMKILAYADDLILLMDDVEDLQKVLIL